MSDMSGQSAGGVYRPAGWYYAQGDPPDTQRYWDGSAWQGDPQPVNRSAQYSTMDSSTGQSTTGYSDYQAPSVSAPAPSPAPDPETAAGDDWGAPPSGAPASGSSGSVDLGGFLSTLFDTKFTSFITGRAISVVYILVIIAVALITLFFVIGGLAGGGATALVALILGPLVGLFYLVMIRMTLEFFVNQFRQTELLESITEKLDRNSD